MNTKQLKVDITISAYFCVLCCYICFLYVDATSNCCRTILPYKKHRTITPKNYITKFILITKNKTNTINNQTILKKIEVEIIMKNNKNKHNHK